MISSISKLFSSKTFRCLKTLQKERRRELQLDNFLLKSIVILFRVLFVTFLGFLSKKGRNDKTFEIKHIPLRLPAYSSLR